MLQTKSRSHREMVELLIFAHRGEARAFLKEYPFRVVTDTPPPLNLYNYSTPERSVYLLICGEGRDKAMTLTTSACTYLLNQNIALHVYNFGLAASLDSQKYPVGNVVEIRTLYSQSFQQDVNKKFEFKSFSTQNASKSKADLISSFERVLSAEYRNKFLNIATLVDREGWSIGYVCQQFKIPFDVIKVVSDYAENEVCAQVKEQVEQWSDQLLRAYQRDHPKIDLKASSQKNPYREDLGEQIIQWAGESLYLTISQERHYFALTQALQIKNAQFSDLKAEIEQREIIKDQRRPKDNAKNLLQFLKEKIRPLDTQIKMAIDRNLAVMRNAGIQVGFDEQWENETLTLHMTLASEEDKLLKMRALKNHCFQEWINILKGEF